MKPRKRPYVGTTSPDITEREIRNALADGSLRLHDLKACIYRIVKLIISPQYTLSLKMFFYLQSSETV